jgi:hypothetical protein
MKPLPLILWVLCGIGVTALSLAILMLHRNRLVYQWRTRANCSWAARFQLVNDLLKQNPYMWAHFPDDFDWILQTSSKFCCEIYGTLPPYNVMMNNLRAWNYEQATGDYEVQLELTLQMILDRVHEVEDKYELLEQGYL